MVHGLCADQLADAVNCSGRRRLPSAPLSLPVALAGDASVCWERLRRQREFMGRYVAPCRPPERGSAGS